MPTSFFIGRKISFQKVGEKENFQDNKHDEKFDKDYNPNLAPPIAHVLKAAEVEIPDSGYYLN
jgi:hypothetical protein